MYQHPFTVCIASAGIGSRLGGDVPKQYAELGGIPVLVHTIAVFDALPQCTRIVIASGDRNHLKTLFVKYPVSTECMVVDGGAMRQDSVASMLTVCPNDDDSIVLIHDAARPCVDRARILAVVDAIAEHGAAILALPARDTVKRVAHGRVTATIDRRSIWLAQTPQGARVGLLRRAFAAARQDGYLGTDDAELLERIGCGVTVVEGVASNIKITYAEDIALAEVILQQQGRSGDV